jgi:hypothetical protein
MKLEVPAIIARNQKITAQRPIIPNELVLRLVSPIPPRGPAYPIPWTLSALMVKMMRTWSRPPYHG